MEKEKVEDIELPPGGTGLIRHVTFSHAHIVRLVLLLACLQCIMGVLFVAFNIAAWAVASPYAYLATGIWVGLLYTLSGILGNISIFKGNDLLGLAFTALSLMQCGLWVAPLVQSASGIQFSRNQRDAKPEQMAMNAMLLICSLASLPLSVTSSLFGSSMLGCCRTYSVARGVSQKVYQDNPAFVTDGTSDDRQARNMYNNLPILNDPGYGATSDDITNSGERGFTPAQLYVDILHQDANYTLAYKAS